MDDEEDLPPFCEKPCCIGEPLSHEAAARYWGGRQNTDAEIQRLQAALAEATAALSEANVEIGLLKSALDTATAEKRRLAGDCMEMGGKLAEAMAGRESAEAEVAAIRNGADFEVASERQSATNARSRVSRLEEKSLALQAEVRAWKGTAQGLDATCQRYYEEVRQLVDERDAATCRAEVAEGRVGALVRALWLRHGHAALYGDDGEMQCGQCMLDFKRSSVEAIIGTLEDAALAGSAGE